MQATRNAHKQGALWGAEARDWVEIQEPMALELWRAALDATGVGPGTRLLDAGCGAGGALIMARASGAAIAGCDVSENLLAIARDRLPDAALVLGELEALPFAAAQFDSVVAVNSIQFTSDAAQAARDLVRVAAPGGRIAVVVWSMEHCEQRDIFEAILRLFDHPPKGRGVFALSAPGEVEALFPALVTSTQEIDCIFSYASPGIALRGQMAAGPSQRVVEIFGRAPVEAAIRDALTPFISGSGAVRLQNRFRCVMARVPGK